MDQVGQKLQNLNTARQQWSAWNYNYAISLWRSIHHLVLLNRILEWNFWTEVADLATARWI